MKFDSDGCEEKIGYTFKDKALLRRCFVHSSYANEHGEESNERLEFLGDSIVNFVVAEYLFQTYGSDEGTLTHKRTEFVSSRPLAETVRAMGLDRFLIKGNGEIHRETNGKMCEDLFEAVVAGIYLDGGLANAEKFIRSNLIRSGSVMKEDIKDCKGSLQEYVQKNKLGTISYAETARSGPDHARQFTCAVALNGKVLASGSGTSKKQAEQCAAEKALALFKAQPKQ